MNVQDTLARKICDELNLDEEQFEIISYGAFAFIQILISIAAVAFFGWIFGVMLEALIVSFATSILRQYSGGVHASEPASCVVIGTAVSVGVALFTNYISHFLNLNTAVIIIAISFLLSIYIVYKNAPVDSKAKPIKTESKRKKMRRKSFAVMVAYLLFSIAFLLYSRYIIDTNVYIFALDICGGMLFQVFSLTIIGRILLAKVDKGLTRVLYRR